MSNDIIGQRHGMLVVQSHKSAGYGFLSPTVDASASILPDMALHHPSRHTLAKAFLSPWAGGAGFAVTVVLAVALPGGGPPVEVLVLRADVRVEAGIISEAVFSVVFAFVRMTSVTYVALYAFGFQ